MLFKFVLYNSDQKTTENKKSVSIPGKVTLKSYHKDIEEK